MGFAKQYVSSVALNRTVKDELAQGVGLSGPRRRISVTDLLNPRRAFFHWTRPDIRPIPERVQAMLSGTGFHDLFERSVSKDAYTEQFVEAEGVVGKIDIYEDFPTELKTTSFLPDDIVASRPAFIDQLGMYCAMTGRSEGRLIVYKRAGQSEPAVLRAYSVIYDDISDILREMQRRRQLFATALATGDPAGLPACEWLGLGCEYEGICGCESMSPQERIVAAARVRLSENPSLAEGIGSRLRVGDKPAGQFRLNDLVFPRKAILERQSDSEEDGGADEELRQRLSDLDKQGFRHALVDAMRFTVPGAFQRTPVRLRTLTGSVMTYRGVPTVVRATKLLDFVERHRVAEAMGHYVDRLAIECALSGNPEGRLVVYYQAMPEDKFLVYDIAFRDLDSILAEADRRLQLLESGAPLADLPPCPAWMTKFCKHAPACGCGKASRLS